MAAACFARLDRPGLGASLSSKSAMDAKAFRIQGYVEKELLPDFLPASSGLCPPHLEMWQDPNAKN